MAYENDERDMDLDEQSNFFEEDPIYSSDTYFGERIDSAPDAEELEDDSVIMEDETLVTESEAMSSNEPAEGFGEKMPSDSKDESEKADEWADLTDDE